MSVALMFTMPDGRPVGDGDIRYVWDNARKAAGHGSDVHGSVNFHRLRHTYACELINANVDAKTVMTTLGHANITTTYDTYGWALDRSHDRVRTIVNSMRNRHTATVTSIKAA